MRHNLNTVKSMYDIDRKTASAVMAMLANLNPGEEFDSKFGRIKKTADNKFEIIFTPKNISNIVDELTDDGHVSNLFG